MASTFNESLFDFDLNFLHPPTPNDGQNKFEKQRKAILVVKKKTIATDALIKKYYAKKDILDQTENSLLTSKEECKQICIDYRKSMETCSKLENDMQMIRNVNKELETKCFQAENQYAAATSLINQLQMLVKEQETQIESLTIESSLTKSNLKDQDKKLSVLQKENEVLLKHMCLARDIILKKKKLNSKSKSIIKTYEKHKYTSDHDSDNESDTDDSFDEAPSSPMDVTEETDKIINQTSSLKSSEGKIIAQCDSLVKSDGTESNDVVSVDTGRGSSLAFSDSDKCFHSPDYYMNDSPKSDAFNLNKSQKLQSTATSPIIFTKLVEMSTSPVLFEEQVNDFNKTDGRNKWSIFDSPQKRRCSQDSRDVDVAVSPNQAQSIDIATSPIKHFHIDSDVQIQHVEKASSPIIFTEYKNTSTSPNRLETANNTTSPIKHFITKEIVPLVQEDKALSPIKLIKYKNVSTCTSRVHTMDVTTSPIKKVSIERHLESPSKDKSLSPVYAEHPKNTLTSTKANKSTNSVNSTEIVHTGTLINNKINDHELSNTTNSNFGAYINVEKQINKEKECLQLHNSDAVRDDSISDSEIEMILSSMRMHHKLITPIPLSPIKSKSIASHISKVSVPNKCKDTKTQENVCHDAALVREENRKLQASVADLVKEVLSIKLMLQKQNLPTIPEDSQDLVKIKEKSFVENNLTVDISPSKNLKKTKKSMSRKLFNDGIVDKNKEPKQKDCIQNKSIDIAIDEIVQCQERTKDSSKSPGIEGSPNNNVHRSCDQKSMSVCEEVSVYERNNDACQINDNCNYNSSNVTELAFDSDHSSFNIAELGFDSDNLSLNITETSPADNNSCLNLTESTSDSDNLSPNHNLSVENNLHFEISSDHLSELSTSKKDCKSVKVRKLTKLDKFKQKMLPKCKIKTDEALPKKLLMKSCKVLIPRMKRIVTNSDTSVTLNRKDVYENAVKIMNELKAKQNHNTNSKEQSESYHDTEIHTPLKRNNPQQYKPHSKIENNIQSNENINHENNLNNDIEQVKPLAIITRSRSKSFTIKEDEVSPRKSARLERINSKLQDDQTADDDQAISELCRKRLRQDSGEKPNNMEPVPCKRVLRSTTTNVNTLRKQSNVSNRSDTHELVQNIELIDNMQQKQDNAVSPKSKRNPKISSLETSTVIKDVELVGVSNPKDSILCTMIQKYGVKCVRYCAKKLPDSITNTIVKKIEEGVEKITELPASDTKKAMDKLVAEFKKYDTKHFMAALIKYLKSPDRKTELFKTINSPPAPPMTKSEQVLLYIISQMNMESSTDIVEELLQNIEFTLFALNRTPEFVVIESMSHFYAVLCRYFRFKSRLRVFIMDAMYCMQFKAVPLIKQCLEVWMLILPLAHMGIAKSPLVTCLVYLLHFYKCEDKFNRVQEIRNILYRKYFYQVTEWNETKIMEMLRSSIMEIRPLNIERKMLRMAIIIFAKRHGTKWCQKNIINKILLPMVEKENIPNRVREFCLSMLGPLMKPYPADMKVHCEVVMNQLIDMFQQNPPDRVKEAIVASLLYMDRHNQFRVLKLLIEWRPKTISQELEEALRDFVKSKPLKTWTITLSKLKLHDK